MRPMLTADFAAANMPLSALMGERFMAALLFPEIVRGQGYEDIAQAEVTRIEGWLRRTADRPKPWNILRVAPHMERRVRDTLAASGLTVYVPEEKRWPKGYRLFTKAEKLRAKPITRPVIPGLVFALLPDDDALDIVDKNHACRLMIVAERPVKVRSIDIAALALFEACKAFDETWEPPKKRRTGKRNRSGGRWKSGQRVKVTHGPFAGFLAEVVSANREDRLKVSLTIFGRATDAEMEDGWVEALDGAMVEE